MFFSKPSKSFNVKTSSTWLLERKKDPLLLPYTYISSSISSISNNGNPCNILHPISFTEEEKEFFHLNVQSSLYCWLY